MRIISGEYKGRRLAPIKGADIRYTSDRVKESLFSILSSTVSGSRFLDIFAGSGNVGIEALSRGAESLTFVDINPVCIRAISSNLEHCGIDPNPPQVKFVKMGALMAIDYFRRRGMDFDIIFLDPPYIADFVEKCLLRISECDILTEDGLVIAEHDVKEKSPIDVGKLVMTRQEKYGTTILSFYKFKVFQSKVWE
jgi:16S rRNA (guanine(966)-N(2))-methyltransferase RsmD